MNKKLTVSQLNNYIKGVFDDELILQNITVTGEIFELKTASSNTYIVLKEGDSTLNCISFSLLTDYQTGSKVSIFGSVRYYTKSAKVSFIIKSIRLEGQGEIIAKLKQTKEKLTKQGVFDNNRPLKSPIQSIALITSEDGAVMHDFFSVLNSLIYLNITVFSVRVQGVGAKNEIINALNEINNDDFDVVVIARGGGSDSDLSEFNSEELALAVHNSKTTVISAVGHETDYTFCDFASDYRVATPSLAAEIIAKNNNNFFNSYLYYSKNISNQILSLLNKKSKKLFDISDDIEFKIKKTLDYANKKCTLISYKMQASLQNILNKKESDFKVLCARINELSPLKTLSKGYGKITKDKKVIKSVDRLQINDKINITLTDGDILASVEEKRLWNLKKSY